MEIDLHIKGDKDITADWHIVALDTTLKEFQSVHSLETHFGILILKTISLFIKKFHINTIPKKEN